MNYVITRNENPDELMHFGVKGMKWGHRKAQAQSTTGSKKISDKSESQQKKKGLSDKQKKAIKIGAAVAGTALAAYGAYKLHNFVRQKNMDIRIDEGKNKCDRMLKKLDRMRINDRVSGSNGTEKWVNPRSYKRSGIQRNNNGRTVTLAREYRNTQSTLKDTQYKNIERKVIDKTISDAFDKAKNDSFATATKNVSKHYLEKVKRYVGNR